LPSLGELAGTRELAGTQIELARSCGDTACASLWGHRQILVSGGALWVMLCPRTLLPGGASVSPNCSSPRAGTTTTFRSHEVGAVQGHRQILVSGGSLWLCCVPELICSLTLRGHTQILVSGGALWVMLCPRTLLPGEASVSPNCSSCAEGLLIRFIGLTSVG
jgi:hypothetical protein